MPAATPARTPPRPRLSWGDRLQHWWHERLTPTDTLALGQRNVFILPTRAGWLFAMTLLVLLVASINYQLNLGHLLTFLLAGAALAAMHITHANLRGLTLKLRAPQPVFAGEPAQLEVSLSDGANRPRHGIGLSTRKSPASAGRRAWAWTDVPAQGHGSARVSFLTHTRGRHGLPALHIETRFPLGIFRAWSVWRPAALLTVYPAPEAAPPPLPAVQAVPDTGARLLLREGSETDGVRPYRRGDALKRVLWKKAAKTDELVSRDTSAPGRQELWLDFQQAGPPDTEARLSRLTAWVLAAERAGLAYGLRLPGPADIAPDRGDAHRRRCLERLALHG